MIVSFHFAYGNCEHLQFLAQNLLDSDQCFYLRPVGPCNNGNATAGKDQEHAGLDVDQGRGPAVPLIIEFYQPVDQEAEPRSVDRCSVCRRATKEIIS
jgi:hypothetical protein